MKPFRDWSIRRKLTFLFVAMACVTTVIVSVSIGIFDLSGLKQSMAQDLSTLADVLGQNSTAALTFQDADAAHSVLQALQAKPNVTAACIYSADGKPFATYVRRGMGPGFVPPSAQGQMTSFESGRLVLFRRIVFAGETIGTIYIESDLQPLRVRLREYGVATLATALMMFVLAFLIAPRLQRPISRPLTELVQTVKDISNASDYSVRANLTSRDEFGTLVVAFNGMLDQIEERNGQLRQHRERLEEQVASRTAELFAANARLKLQAEALNAASNSILITNLAGKIVWSNPAFTNSSGYSLDEVLGKNPRLLNSGKQEKDFYAQMWATISSGATWSGEIVNRRKDGTLYHEEMAIAPVSAESGGVTHFVAIKQDITDRKRAEEALRQSEEQYRLLFDSNPIPMWVFDRMTLRFLAVNTAAIRQYGFTEPEFLAMTIADIRPPEDIPVLLQDVAAGIQGLQESKIWKHRKKNGAVIDVELICNGLDFHGADAMLVAAYDITERKRAEQALSHAEEKYRAIFEDAVVGIFQIDAEGRPISINRALAQMHGYDSPQEFIARISNVALQLFVDPTRMTRLKREMNENGVVQGVELEVYRKDGAKKWVVVNMRTGRNTESEVVLFEGTVEDITERKVAEERVKFLAYYDALTELPNRILLQDRITKALAGARRRKEKIAVLFLDLDRFKIINDSLGHSAGDTLLREVAARLKAWARDQDTVARVGGDELVLLLTSVQMVSDAAVAAQRVVDLMASEFSIHGRSLNVTCSVGVSMFPDHGLDAETLMKNADAAMYCAKQRGPNNVHFFTDDLNAQMVERLTLEHDLRLALGRKEFFLVYQPQMEIATGRIVGLEALLRWQHPELGLVPPDKFIRIAENSGLILPIGEWVLRTACSQARKWQDEGLPPVQIAVNVSAIQFRQDGFRELIQGVLAETGVTPQNLVLELTESLLLTNADVVFSVLQELSEMGLKLAIDDFGTGYSSLSYLTQFPVSKLKIDRSFIRDVATNPNDAAITTAIIGMAKSLNLKVIAEGVETEAQMAFLRAHHCDEIQGYYFSKPLLVVDAADRLRGTASEALHVQPFHVSLEPAAL
jgi:diguanylate cyclase (GGDEF)-like protein/PAS domain S-box-containing protein